MFAICNVKAVTVSRQQRRSPNIDDKLNLHTHQRDLHFQLCRLSALWILLKAVGQISHTRRFVNKSCGDMAVISRSGPTEIIFALRDDFPFFYTISVFFGFVVYSGRINVGCRSSIAAAKTDGICRAGNGSVGYCVRCVKMDSSESVCMRFIDNYDVLF